MCSISSEDTFPPFVVLVVKKCRHEASVNSKKPRSVPLALLPTEAGRVAVGGSCPAADPQSIPFPATFSPPALRDPHPPPQSQPGAFSLGLLAWEGSSCDPSALRHLSPPCLLLSVFQKCVEIPHLLTPCPPSLLWVYTFFCSFTII